MSQSDVARACSTTQQTISRIEGDKSAPTLTTLQEIARPGTLSAGSG